VVLLPDDAATGCCSHIPEVCEPAVPAMNRIRAAIEALRDEADALQSEHDHRYPYMVQQGQITALQSLSNRIAILRHLANQIANV
jgi:hypothetical protein